MGLPYLVTKILKFFVTSLMIAMSKKLIFYIERLIEFNTSEAAITYVTCVRCENKYRLEVLRKIDCLDVCPNCYRAFNITQEVLSEHDRTKFNNRPSYGNWAREQ